MSKKRAVNIVDETVPEDETISVVCIYGHYAPFEAYRVAAIPVACPVHPELKTLVAYPTSKGWRIMERRSGCEICEGKDLDSAKTVAWALLAQKGKRRLEGAIRRKIDQTIRGFRYAPFTNPWRGDL
ncbi:MAG: hypothetical protein GXY38_14300 [Planctomycetes bacterium]|nr:hypothetical protein [Planctomycetota bacterium]